MRSPKILFFIAKGKGGAQKISILISKMLFLCNYDVKIIFVGKEKEQDMSDLVPEGIPVEYLTIKNVWDFLTIRVFAKIKKNRPDLVFSSIMYLNIRVILAAKIYRKVKIVIRQDNMLDRVRKDWLFLVKKTYPMATIIIAQQQEMKLQMQEKLGLKPESVVVLNNPVDYDDLIKKSSTRSPYEKYPMNIVKYVWSGNFMESGSKGQDILIKAFKIVHEKTPSAHLFLLGLYDSQSYYYKKIKNFIVENKLDYYVHILGFQENPYPWIKFSDCFVMPSRIEGLPNALIESMFLGKPVVASKCIPIIEEIVKDSYNGYLVEVGDFESMAKAMEKACLLHDFCTTYKAPSCLDVKKIFDRSFLC